MFSHLHISQLDILGFTAVYRLFFMLAICMIVFTLIMLSCIRFLIRRKYIALLVFLFASCLLSLTILLYDKYIAIAPVEGIWIKVMAGYSFIYAVILFIKHIRRRQMT